MNGLTEQTVERSGPQQEPTTVGRGEYVVEDGDCLESIAFASGHFWETLWNLPDNADIKRTRKTPNILLPGDRLTVPEIQVEWRAGATETTHRFRRRGVPSRLAICIKECGSARAHEPYRLTIDGAVFQGTTDADGWVRRPLPPDAREGELVVGKHPLTSIVIPLQFGGMHPLSELTGIQQRLGNLGFGCEPSGELDEATLFALASFQKANNLEPTAELNSGTIHQLRQAHGS